jgi:hypothetical protein
VGTGIPETRLYNLDYIVPLNCGAVFSLINNSNDLNYKTVENAKKSLQIASKFTKDLRVYNADTLDLVLTAIDQLGPEYQDIDIYVSIYIDLELYVTSTEGRLKLSKDEAYQNEVNTLIHTLNRSDRPKGKNIKYISMGNEVFLADFYDVFSKFKCHLGNNSNCQGLNTWQQIDNLSNDFIMNKVYKPFFDAMNDICNQIILVRDSIKRQTGKNIKIGISESYSALNREFTGTVNRVIDKHWWNPFFLKLDFYGYNLHVLYDCKTNRDHDYLLRERFLSAANTFYNRYLVQSTLSLNDTQITNHFNSPNFELIISETGLPTTGYLPENPGNPGNPLDPILSMQWRRLFLEWIKTCIPYKPPTKVYWQSIFNNIRNPGVPIPLTVNGVANDIYKEWGLVRVIENPNKTVSYFLKNTTSSDKSGDIQLSALTSESPPPRPPVPAIPPMPPIMNYCQTAGMVPQVPTIQARGGLNSIVLTITDRSNGGSPITGYKYSTDGGNNWLPVPNNKIITTTSTRGILVPTTLYNIRVVSINANGPTVFNSSTPYSAVTGIEPRITILPAPSLRPAPSPIPALAQAAVGVAPGLPSIRIAQARSEASTHVKISWTSLNAVGNAIVTFSPTINTSLLPSGSNRFGNQPNVLTGSNGEVYYNIINRDKKAGKRYRVSIITHSSSNILSSNYFDFFIDKFSGGARKTRKLKKETLPKSRKTQI